MPTRWRRARRGSRESGALAVHAFDQVETLLGQGTLGLELDAQAPGLDTLLVAVGGGGLIGGIAAWYAGADPGDRRRAGGRADAAPRRSRPGQPVDAPAGSIAADSLAPRRVGELMFPIARAYVDRVVLVRDDAIRAGAGGAVVDAAAGGRAGGAAALAALLAAPTCRAPASGSACWSAAPTRPPWTSITCEVARF